VCRGLGAEGDSIVGIERRLAVPDSSTARFVVGKYIRVGTVVLEVAVVCDACYNSDTGYIKAVLTGARLTRRRTSSRGVVGAGAAVG
jgi:hypothetical protein